MRHMTAGTPRPRTTVASISTASAVDSTHGIALWLVARLTTTGLDQTLFGPGYSMGPTDEQKHLFTLFSVGGPVIVSLVGVGWAHSPTRREPAWRNTP